MRYNRRITVPYRAEQIATGTTDEHPCTSCCNSGSSRVIAAPESGADSWKEQYVMGQSEVRTKNESGAVADGGSSSASPIDSSTLADERGPIPSFPPLALDPETGRMIAISDEEFAARRSAAVRMLAALEQLTDENDTDEKWREVYRNIDLGRPHRPLFRGLY